MHKNQVASLVQQNTSFENIDKNCNSLVIREIWLKTTTHFTSHMRQIMENTFAELVHEIRSK